MPAERLRGNPEGLVATVPDRTRTKRYGTRKDGSPKGPGYFGEIARSDDPESYSTELTTELSFDGKPLLLPVIVPTLTAEEIAHLVDGGQPTVGILNKAVQHAFERIQSGKSPFADFGEQAELPRSAASHFNEGYEGR